MSFNFNFNVNNFVSNFLWSKARKPIIIDYCQSLLTPLSKKHQEIFPTFYDTTKDRANWSSQTIVLEEILNEEYGFTYNVGATNSIFITHLDDTIDNFFYNKTEFSGSRPIYLANRNEIAPFIGLYNKYELETSFDFEINMPKELNDVRLKIITNNLKIAGVKYLVKKY